MTNKSETNGINPNRIELVYIVDKSGSMAGLESDTIGGFNASIDKQKQLDGEVTVSLVLFDHNVEVVLDRVDLKEVKPLDTSVYQVGGCTALLDAVGGAVKHIKQVQGYMPDGYKAGHVIFTIITDGLENASKKYTYGQVKEMIQGCEAQNWEFLFLGANIDAAAEADRIGIKEDRQATYISDSVGTQIANKAMADAVYSMCSVGVTERINGQWAAPVNADMKKRGKKGIFNRF